MCHRASATTAWHCPCGHEFGQSSERVRARLRDQQTNAWITLVAVAVIGAAGVCGMVYAALQGFIVFSGLGFTALILVTARTVRTLLVTRASLQQLDRLDAAVPRAVVHRPRRR
jgi:uncharacterized membrane protein